MSVLTKNVAKELHKPIRRPKNFRQMTVYFVNEIWSVDLIEFTPFKVENEDYVYCLNCIDCKSRFAWVEGLKSKNANDVLKGFKTVIARAKAKPSKIWVDQGKEFYNRKFEDYLKENSITMYSSFGESKAFLVERFNRTFKDKLYQLFTQHGNHNWIDFIQEIADEYNNSRHSSIGMTPKKAYKNSYIDKVNPTEFSYKNSDEKPKFKIGDRVRISIRQQVFDKSYLPKWSYEIFKISEILPTTPITYRIKDSLHEEIQGSFYDSELQKTNQKEGVYLIEKVIDERKVKGKKQFLVKFIGYTDKHNSWIDDNDFVKEV